MSNDLDFLDGKVGDAPPPTFLKEGKRYVFTVINWKGEKVGEKQTGKVTLNLRAISPVDHDPDFSTALRETEAIYWMSEKTKHRLDSDLEDTFGQPRGQGYKTSLDNIIGDTIVGTVQHEKAKDKEGNETGFVRISAKNLRPESSLANAA